MDAAFLDALWKSTDIAAIAAALIPGGRLVRGDEWAGKCPYCGTDEKDPKFSVNLKDAKYKCFKCQESGNLITLAQRLWGREWQREWASVCPATKEALGNPGEPKKPKGERRPPKSPGDVYTAASADPKALEPLASAWGVPIEALLRQGWRTLPGDDWPYGLCAKQPDGTITDVKKRRLPPVPEGLPKARNLGGSKAGLFGVEALQAKPEAVVLIIEGEKDWAVAEHELPDYAVVGLGSGASCWVHPLWTSALVGRDVILCHDPDEAGNKGATKVADFLVGRAKRIRRLPALEGDIFHYLRGDQGKPQGTADDFRKILTSSVDFSPPFDPARYMRNRIEGEVEGDEDIDWTALGEETYQCLLRAGARFITLDGGTQCVYGGALMAVSGRDPRWQRLMLDLTGFTTVPQEGRIIREVVSLRAAQNALVPDVSPAWCVYHGGCVYVNQSNQSGSQIRISKDSIEVVPNGADGVVTVPNEGVLPINVIPEADFDPFEAEAATDRAASYFSCDDDSRSFLRWYLLTVFLYPLAQTHPVIRFRGDSASGKSTCAKALTTILYGAPYLISSTQAALYRSARRRPLTAIDNLEERDFARDSELVNFVLVSATGRAREKSARDTDSGVIREEVKSLFLSTGIEPVGIDKPEIVNRTIEVQFDIKYGAPGFYEQGYLEHLKKERDVILNLAMRVTRDTLKDVAEGKLQKVMKTFPADKRRLAEFFCLMSLSQTGGEGVNDVVLGWTSMMGEAERRTHIEGNPLVPLLLAIPKVDAVELGITWSRDGTKVTTEPCRAPDLFRALSYIAKKFGLRMPYSDPQTMATRLGEGAKNLLQYGVEVVKSKTASGGQRLTSLRIDTARPQMEGDLF